MFRPIEYCNIGCARTGNIIDRTWIFKIFNAKIHAEIIEEDTSKYENIIERDTNNTDRALLPYVLYSH